MKIVHIITGLSTGGAERALFNLLEGGLASKTKCVVVSLGDEGSYGKKIRQLGVDVYTLNITSNLGLFKGAIKLKRLMIALRPDIIQGWMYHGNLAASYASLVLNNSSKLLWNVRHSLHDLKKEKVSLRIVIFLSRWLVSHVDGVVYNSEVSKKQHEALGFDNGKGYVIFNGFKTELLRPSSETRIDYRRNLGIDQSSIVIGHVARYHPMKDHRTFIESAVNLLSKHSDTFFLLIGRGVTEKNKALMELIPENLKRNFMLLGEREDVYSYMQAMDFFCLSSAWGEGFPNVLGEAMSIGIVCVTTDVGDSANLIDENGIVVTAGDTIGLTGAMNRLIELSQDDIVLLKHKMRARICNNFDLSNIVDQYLSMYSRIFSDIV